MSGARHPSASQPVVAPLAVPPAIGNALRRLVDLIGGQNLSLLIALTILVVLIGSQNGKFFLPQNLLNIGQNIAVVGLVATVETVIIVAGCLDISVGAIAGVASVVCALAVVNTGSPAAGIVAGMVAGLLCGVINGLIITIGRVNTIIATLATLSAFRGLAFIIAPDGKPVGVINEGFNTIGTGRVAVSASVGIPVPLLILLAVGLLVHVFLTYSDLGRAVYAMGGNAIAARLAGIDLRRMTVGIYMLSGVGAGLAGIVVTARTFSGQPQSGTDGLELEAITAAFLGGCAIQGGKGTIAGTLLAVLLIGTLSNGMSLLGMPTFYQLVAKGLLLVLAVAIQQWRLARAERARTSLIGRAPTSVA